MKTIFSVVLAVAALLIGGCSLGDAPSGGSPEQVKAAFDQLPLEDRAKSIMGSPAPQEFKEKQIKDMYAKEGKEVPPDLLRGNGSAH